MSPFYQSAGIFLIFDINFLSLISLSVIKRFTNVEKRKKVETRVRICKYKLSSRKLTNITREFDEEIKINFSLEYQKLSLIIINFTI